MGERGLTSAHLGGRGGLAQRDDQPCYVRVGTCQWIRMGMWTYGGLGEWPVGRVGRLGGWGCDGRGREGGGG